MCSIFLSCWKKKLSTEELMLLNCGVGEDSWESLDCKEIKPVHPKENQPWIFIGRTDAEAPILWPPDAKSWLIGKDPDAGKDWRQEEKGMTEDEMVGWHHWLNGRECEQTPGNGEGQGSWHAAAHGVAKSQTRLRYTLTEQVKNNNPSPLPPSKFTIGTDPKKYMRVQRGMSKYIHWSAVCNKQKGV